jgi:hypothetical protein
MRRYVDACVVRDVCVGVERDVGDGAALAEEEVAVAQPGVERGDGGRRRARAAPRTRRDEGRPGP